MNTDPREVVQLADRITDVIRSEFPSLSPADVVFCLELLQHTYISAFEKICQDKGIIPKL